MSGIPTPIDLVGAGAAATPTAADAARSPEQLRQLAAQFEALLLSQMLSQMRSSLFEADEEASGFGGGPLGDVMFSELSLALSRAGGFGLSESMLEPLARQAGAIDTATGGLGMPASAMDAVAMPTSAPVTRAALFEGRMTSAFGWRTHPVSGRAKFHAGVDIAMPVGRDVPVAQTGQVTFAGEQGGYGLTVIVEHANGVSTRYAHLSEIRVAAGETVVDGQTLGLSGATGRVTGPHLHFEVLEHGKPIDPHDGVGKLYASR